MTDTPMTFTWNGKQRDELLREELIEAILYLVSENSRLVADLNRRRGQLLGSGHPYNV